MNSNYIESTSQIHQQEHDGEDTGTRKVLLYGWDYTNLVKRRVAVNASGELIIEGGTVSPTTYHMLMEDGSALLQEGGDNILIEY